LKLGLIVNCIGYDNKCVDVSEKLLKEIFPVLDKFEIEREIIIPNSDWIKTKITKHDSLTFQDAENVRKVLKTKDNKGIIVRGCVEEFQESNVNFILHIDGSGKFDLGDINRVIEVMIEPSVDAVLTKRNISGMDKFRTVIEKFERKIILLRFPNAIIEDGQSGCWSVRLGDSFKPLTASGYEIELEILIQQLENNNNILWLPVQIEDTKISLFNFVVHINKMQWLANRLSIRKEQILDSLKKFK